MKQVALLSHSLGTPYLQDLINKWIIKAEANEWKIIDIFIPSGGIVAIVYEVINSEEIAKIRTKFNKEF